MSEVLSFSYWFWPNPGNLYYNDPKAMLALGACAALIVLAFVISMWRKRVSNPVTRKLSRSWSTAAVWFGITGLVMIVSRVESILFLGMRALWIVWVLCLLAYIVLQVVQFRRRHYTVVRSDVVADPRDPYLPRKKKRS